MHKYRATTIKVNL